MFKYNKKNRVGTSLQDGVAAHAADHNQWSRRQFLSGSSMMAAGGLIFGSSPLLSWASPLLASLTENSDNDRVLILIRLNGGNDGLNTIVPFGDNYRRFRYEDLRQNIKINCNELTPLELGEGSSTTVSEFALPNWASGLHNLWNDKKMGIIHNVGYSNHNRSHFAGSDLWANGANNTSQPYDSRKYTGWMGRYFNQTLPAFLSTPPTIPPVIQIGASSNLMFRGVKGTPYDLIFSDLEAFDEVIQTGQLYNNGMFGEESCAADVERSFVRRVANNTLRYAETVQQAYNASSDGNGYQGDGLSEQLKIVSRLIKGGLKTKIYMVSLGTFDTHANQTVNHRALIQKLSDAVSAAQADLGTEHADRVLMMTFSEFGRTVKQNGIGDNSGTDHGTLAPIMLFGNAVEGKNFYGTPIDLGDDKVDNIGLIDFDTQDGALDFRTVYEKVLRDWLCADAETVDNVLAPKDPNVADYIDCSTSSLGSTSNDAPTCTDTAVSHPTKGCEDTLGGMIKGGCNSTVSQSSTLDAYIASLVVFGYNIKAEDNTKIEFKYATKTTANVTLEIFDENRDNVMYLDEDGVSTQLQSLVEKYHEAGSYTYEFDTQPEVEDITLNILYPNTKYICRLEVNGMVVERTLIIN